ncbi:protein-methionine-sulfoxide reductase catalytic subunit MsrP [Thalassoglobus sp.]|uniref:protein-methionine-sulfoxide reductase catalytic subunit MsrP n=1 Tax=Thalassoglobus sp. TaxID=2795869 RepID=UPI003AA9B317
MNYFVRRPWDLPQNQITDQSIYSNKTARREFLKSIGVIAGAGLSASMLGCKKATLEEIDAAGEVEEGKQNYPFPRNEKFEYGRAESVRKDAAQYTNFYEFSTSKEVFRYVEDFEPTPWKVSVTGLCKNPKTFDLDDIYKEFTLEERAYRHRCVETWSMCVPWTGFPFSDLLAKVEPLASAKYVRLVTFMDPKVAPMQQHDEYPWAYSEGVTIEEAMNPLMLLATGIYGAPLPKQHGAPVRLVAPWKYGFKSIKSIVKIELTDKQPATFWNTLMPHEYGFEANVDPEVPHPRWSQATEWMLGSRERFPTVKYNGYGDYVASMYKS